MGNIKLKSSRNIIQELTLAAENDQWLELKKENGGVSYKTQSDSAEISIKGFIIKIKGSIIGGLTSLRDIVGIHGLEIIEVNSSISLEAYEEFLENNTNYRHEEEKKKIHGIRFQSEKDKQRFLEKNRNKNDYVLL